MTATNASITAYERKLFASFGLAATCFLLVICDIVPFKVSEARWIPSSPGKLGFQTGKPDRVEELAVNGTAIVLLVIGGLSALFGVAIVQRGADDRNGPQRGSADSARTSEPPVLRDEESSDSDEQPS